MYVFAIFCKWGHKKRVAVPLDVYKLIQTFYVIINVSGAFFPKLFPYGLLEISLILFFKSVYLLNYNIIHFWFFLYTLRVLKYSRFLCVIVK